MPDPASEEKETAMNAPARLADKTATITLPVEGMPVLPGTIPVLRWFAEERQHAGATHRG